MYSVYVMSYYVILPAKILKVKICDFKSVLSSGSKNFGLVASLPSEERSTFTILKAFPSCWNRYNIIFFLEAKFINDFCEICSVKFYITD